MMTLVSFSIAFQEVVVDALMCLRSKVDPHHGSQELTAFSSILTGIGGILGCLLGGVTT